MELFNYDFNLVLDYVKEAYVKVYGKQYEQIIRDRLQSAKYIFYDEKSDIDFERKCMQAGFDLNNDKTSQKLLPIKNNLEMVVIRAKGISYNLDDILSYMEEECVKLYGERHRKIVHDILKSVNCVFYDRQNNRFGFSLNDKNTKIYFLPTKTNLEKIKVQNDFNHGVMFFPVSREINGTLDFFFLHECGHIIDQSDCYSGGFDLEFNHYVNFVEYREYEIFDEALTDIFALECRDVLHNSGIYLADKDEITLDSENYNMEHEIKDLVRLLVDDYREAIIYGKITGNHNVLFEQVGKENFDSFNLIINKVQRLIDDGLFSTKNQDLFKEYYELIEEVEVILNRMNDYSMKNSVKR